MPSPPFVRVPLPVEPSPKVPGARCYLINVASARNGVGYGAPWTHLDGFSEHVIRWIAALEGE